jgi:ubiquitin C-terminal hydrolase
MSLLDLVWDSDAPSPAVIVDVLSSISTTISLDRIFNGGALPRRYHLKGLICYYGTCSTCSPMQSSSSPYSLSPLTVACRAGKHYDAYFYNKQRGRWVVFDDATVKEV